jgi:hypothetical protein
LPYFDLVDALDLSGMLAGHVKTSNPGRAGYHPAMMVKLLAYGYAIEGRLPPAS